MPNFFKRNRGEKTLARLFANRIIFTQLIYAKHLLDEEAGVMDIVQESLDDLLPLIDSKQLEKILANTRNQVEARNKELSVLEDMFNAPASDTNN